MEKIIDLYHYIKVWLWNLVRFRSNYRMWYGEIKPAKQFKIDKPK